MVHDQRLFAAIEPPDFADRRQISEWPDRASSPPQGMDRKTGGADRVAVRRDTGCHRDIEAAIECGARHRQSMRAEIPILGDKEDQLRPFTRHRWHSRRAMTR